MRSPKEEAGLPQREQAWGALCRLGALEEQQVGHSAERLYRLAAISPARSPALNSMTLGHYFTFIVCCGASFSEWYPYWWFADEDWELCLSWSHFDFCSPNMLLEVRRMGTDGTGWGEWTGSFAIRRLVVHSGLTTQLFKAVWSTPALWPRKGLRTQMMETLFLST